MKNKPFFDIDHANRYLSGSLIRYAKEPVYVERVRNSSVNRELTCEIYPIKFEGERGKKTISLNDPEIDMNPVPLGYISIDDTANPDNYRHSAYASRIPHRKWSVGLNPGNLYLHPIPHNHPLKNTNVGYGRDQLMFSKQLHNTVMGIYPTLEVAVKLSKKNDQYPRIIAFSRRFAVDGMGSVIYKSLGICGTIDGNNKILLKEEFNFVQQALDEDLK